MPVPELCPDCRSDSVIMVGAGTQKIEELIIAEFPGLRVFITVAGILMADIGLNMPDFRASERIASMLIQLAGRSGRGGFAGRVIIQTLNETHQIFEFVKNHDYWGFYKSELKIRQALMYPPYARLARVLVRGKSEDDVIRSADLLSSELDKLIGSGNSGVVKLGPSPAPFVKIGGNYRYHMILKGGSTGAMSTIIRAAVDSFKNRSVYIEVDIDPVDML
jgi:primosomal protein N' (replication factor Y)